MYWKRWAPFQLVKRYGRTAEPPVSDHGGLL